MNKVAQFSYAVIRSVSGDSVQRPLLPVILTYGTNETAATGLLDTGADVNVLPYQLGVKLGGNWEEARTGFRLSGNLANYEARGILLNCTVGQLPPVRLAFAWTRAEEVPLILGQVNFFAEFDICFFRARNLFDFRTKGSQ